jgi:hypothetical protein
MTREEAVLAVTAKVRLLAGEKAPDENLLTFAIEKLISDILDYCHRDDFPDALIYTVSDLVRKRLAEESAGEDSELGFSTPGPLSDIKMDDTEFRFAVNNVDASAVLNDLSFDSIKPKLNLYRRVVSWA